MSFLIPNFHNKELKMQKLKAVFTNEIDICVFNEEFLIILYDHI